MDWIQQLSDTIAPYEVLMGTATFLVAAFFGIGALVAALFVAYHRQRGRSFDLVRIEAHTLVPSERDGKRVFELHFVQIGEVPLEELCGESTSQVRRAMQRKSEGKHPILLLDTVPAQDDWHRHMQRKIAPTIGFRPDVTKRLSALVWENSPEIDRIQPRVWLFSEKDRQILADPDNTIVPERGKEAHQGPRVPRARAVVELMNNHDFERDEFCRDDEGFSVAFKIPLVYEALAD